MEKKLTKAMDELILSIIECDKFKECVELKEKLNNNNKVKELVDTIKMLQKKYIRTMDSDVKNKLDEVQDELNSIPLYNSYQKKISEVNSKLDFIKEELNDYFYKVVNNNEKK